MQLTVTVSDMELLHGGEHHACPAVAQANVRLHDLGLSVRKARLVWVKDSGRYATFLPNGVRLDIAGPLGEALTELMLEEYRAKAAA